MDASDLEVVNRLSLAVENLTKAIVKLEGKIDRLAAPEPVKAFPSSQPTHPAK
jgi:hypothetical protein